MGSPQSSSAKPLSSWQSTKDLCSSCHQVRMRWILLVYQQGVNSGPRKTTMPGTRLITRIIPMIAYLFLMLGACVHAAQDKPRSEFFRGINLNGPPVAIDGHQWEG